MKKIAAATDIFKPEGEHYFTRKPKSTERPRQLRLFVNGRELYFGTSSGMFSPKKVDNATLLLIENMRLGKRIIDLGCGYGPIGIAAAVARPDSDVVMVEINERAAGLAMDNLSANGIRNALVIESDFFERLVGEKFDTILMNPPMSAGLCRVFDVIEQAKLHLNRRGSLQIVARHGKGGERLEGKMKEVFGNVEEVAKGGGFRVYMSVNAK